MASLKQGVQGVADRPGWHYPGGRHPSEKMWAEFIKNTGQTTSEGGSCDDTTAKKVITFYHFAARDD